MTFGTTLVLILACKKLCQNVDQINHVQRPVHERGNKTSYFIKCFELLDHLSEYGLCREWMYNDVSVCRYTRLRMWLFEVRISLQQYFCHILLSSKAQLVVWHKLHIKRFHEMHDVTLNSKHEKSRKHDFWIAATCRSFLLILCCLYVAPQPHVALGFGKPVSADRA